MSSFGAYETLLREQHIAARKRLFGKPEPQARVARFVAESELEPDYDEEIEDGSPYLPGEAPPPRSDSAAIIKQVALKHKITVADLLSDIRARPIAAARHEAMYRIREERKLSWGRIGYLLNRDHTSCLHGWRRHQARLAEQRVVNPSD